MFKPKVKYRPTKSVCSLCQSDAGIIVQTSSPRCSASAMALGYAAPSCDSMVPCLKVIRPSHLAFYYNTYTCVSGRCISRGPIFVA